MDATLPQLDELLRQLLEAQTGEWNLQQKIFQLEAKVMRLEAELLVARGSEARIGAI